MSITDDEDMRDFNPMEDADTLFMDSKLCVMRTSMLLPALIYMQEREWRLRELQADDENGTEYNILTFYKPKTWKKPKQTS